MEHQRFEVKKVAHSEIIEKTGMMYLQCDNDLELLNKNGVFQDKKGFKQSEATEQRMDDMGFSDQKGFCFHALHSLQAFFDTNIDRYVRYSYFTQMGV